jgi:hypothetical protein
MVSIELERKGVFDMKMTTIGVDLAKAVFRLYGADERSKTALRKRLESKNVLSFFADLEPGLKRDRFCRNARKGFFLQVCIQSPEDQIQISSGLARECRVPTTAVDDYATGGQACGKFRSRAIRSSSNWRQ